MNSIFRGRYGFDRLNIILAVMALLFIFTRYLWIAGVIFIGLFLFRALSRNFPKRQMELRKFEIFFSRISNFLDKLFRPLAKWAQGRKMRQYNRKIYKYIKCRYCKKKLRVPRNKGKIKVTCPDCKNQFIIKT